MDLITLAMAKKYTEKRVAEIGGESPSGVQADWNQNDEVAPDYIKNRPFGETYTIDKTSIWETTVTTTEYGTEGVSRVRITYPNYYSGISGNNDVINVEINGVKYVTSYKTDSYGETIGNGDLSGYSSGHNSEQPFAISNGYGGSYFHTTLGAGTYNIKMYRMKEAITTLDTKFLPDGYPKINYDYATILDNVEVTNQTQLDFVLYEDSNYTVIFDDTEYQCDTIVAYVNGFNLVYIGNPKLAVNGEDNGLPFVVGFYTGNNTTTCLLSSNETHTMSIIGKAEIITSMDEKFIPYTIARKADVGHIVVKDAPIVTAKCDCKQLCNFFNENANNSFYVAYGNGKYVLFGNSFEEKSANIGIPNDIAFYSNDGVTWNQITMPESLIWQGVVYNDGVFVLNGVTRTLSGSTRLYHSTDGINWEQSDVTSVKTNNSSASANYLDDICYLTYINNKFIISYNNNKNCAYSNDGITFYEFTKPEFTYYYYHNIAVGNGVHVCENNNMLRYSTDGCETWEDAILVNADYDDISIAFGNDKFVAFGGKFGGVCAKYSYDGMEWFDCSFSEELITLFSRNEDFRYNIAFTTYTDGMFIAYEQDDSILMCSLDGITWDLAYNKVLSDTYYYSFDNGSISLVNSDGKTFLVCERRIPEENYRRIGTMIYEMTVGNPYGIAKESDIEEKFATKEEVATMAILTSPNGTKYRLAVSDDGTLSTIPVE